MFNRAIRGAGSPKYVSSDHDPLFRFHRWKANLRILEITEVKTVPYLPISHPFVERLIGTIRREYLDFVPFGLLATWRANCLALRSSTTTSGAILRWTVTHPVKKLGRYDRRLQIYIHTAGVVTAEANSSCLSRLEH